jgi:RNA polymerase sigma-70 factor (ECF subfamily)
MRELKDTEQTVVIMRFVDELSIKETAAAVDKSEGAVKLIQHRAIQKLKKLMAEEK